MSSIYSTWTPETVLLATALMMRDAGLDRWTTGACARSVTGIPVAAESPHAHRWCSLGWLIKTFDKETATRTMNWFNKRSRVGALHQINDTLGFFAVINHMEQAAS